MSTRTSSRMVFVGNIPYDATEQQLEEILSEVGPVEKFRLVFDRDTGKPKGYGFCEYRDADTAQSAIRNLNNWVLGGRQLRVDYAETEKAYLASIQNQQNSAQQAQQQPPGNPINGILEGMPVNTIYDVTCQIKDLIQRNPDQARKLLVSNPQLVYALLHAQVMMGMVSPAIVQQMIQQPQQPGPGNFGSIPQGRGPQMDMGGDFRYGQGGDWRGPSMGQMGVPMGGPPMPMGGPPMGPMGGGPIGPMGVVGPMGGGPMGVPPVNNHGGAGFGGPAVGNVGAAGLAGLGNLSGIDLQSLNDNHKALLQQVMSLTPEQLQKLDPKQKAQVQQLMALISSCNR